MKNVLKVIAIIAAIAAAIAGISIVVKKLIEKRKQTPVEEESYVSCTDDEEFISETVEE